MALIKESPVQRLLARLDQLGVRHGREDSFKLGHRRMIANRVLIGVNTASLASARLLAIGSELGMPDACLQLLLPRAPQANAVFFGFEELDHSWVCKVYLEFWDQVRRETRRTGSQAPQLLHFGVKWDSARPGHHEVARYECHPLLNLAAILRRMASCHAGPSPSSALAAVTQEIVRAAARRNPSASMLYLEVSEQGNPRSSFDVNLYKSGLAVADVSELLRQAAAHFELSAESLEAQLERLGKCPLGHLSSGLDRKGNEFLSVYAETAAL